MPRHSPLARAHLAAGARMVDFHGWSLPLHYGSQLAEHHNVRRNAGLFDVSHMTVLDLTGPAAGSFLAGLLANDVGRLKSSGQALYSMMLNDAGGIIDDLIVYLMPAGYRLVTNCATHDRVLGWLAERAATLDLRIEQPEMAILALQGPRFLGVLERAMGADLASRIGALPRFCGRAEGAVWIARTGYTGEDGVEMILPAGAAEPLWEKLLAAGAHPAGLGARDSLRLEAGLNLNGQDMDESITPLEANVAWTVAWKPTDRDFVGRRALAALKAAGVEQILTGLQLVDPGVARRGYGVFADAAGHNRCGEITSGLFSPTLKASIALARVRKSAPAEVFAQIRGQYKRANLIRPPFVRRN